jgi:hypothetical protein
MLSSDPHAWLRPIFARLQTHPAFRQFAPSHQFEQLLRAVEREHPAKAASMREWTIDNWAVEERAKAEGDPTGQVRRFEKRQAG